MANTAQQLSTRSDWITPRDPYILAAEKVFGGQICLDPASSAQANTQIQAQFYFDGDNADGLKMGWGAGDVLQWSADLGGPNYTQSTLWNVWLNPPYGRRDGEKGPYNLTLWIPKLIEEFKSGNVDEAIVLVNAMTAQKWFQPLWQFPICFVDHRIKFLLPETMEPKPDLTQASVFVYLGNTDEGAYAFYKNFGEFGPVIRKMNDEMPLYVLFNDLKEEV